MTYREASEQIRSVSDVEEVSPSTFNEMLLAGKSGRVGVSVKGLPLTGLKNLLDSGVEWEGERLNLLDATLGAEAEGRGVVLYQSCCWHVLDCSSC